MSIEKTLAHSSIEIPNVFATEFDYIPLSISGNLLQVAGHIAKIGDTKVRHEGRLGEDVSIEDAAKNAGHCILQAFASIRAATGTLDILKRPLMLTVYVAVSPTFLEMSKVADGASKMLLSAFGEKEGQHPRSVIGVCRLPRNSPVMIDANFQLRSVGSTS